MSEGNGIKGNFSNERLFRFFADYQKLENYEPSYFDILGISKRELSYSKFLQFFFDTNERHNLKDLFIKSLLKCVNTLVEYDIETEHVLLEYSTNKDGRIDIVIETKNLVIVIENKIEATLYNDLIDYEETIKDNFNKKEIKFIILSMNEISGEKEGFTSVLYSEFVKELKLNLHNYISNVNDKYLLLFKEFVKHIENYNKRGDFNRAKFYFDNEEIIDNLASLDGKGYDKYDFSKILKTKEDYSNHIAKQITEVAFSELLDIEEIKEFTTLKEVRRNKSISASKIGLKNEELKEYGIFFLWIRMCNDGKSLRISTDIEDTYFYKNDKSNMKLKELVKEFKKLGFESKGFSAIYIKREIENLSNENEISKLIVETVKEYWVKNIELIKKLIEEFKIKKLNK